MRLTARWILSATLLGLGALSATLPILAADSKLGPNPLPAAPVQVGQAAFLDAVSQGSVKYVGREIPEAIDLFRKATQLQPRNALGYYLMGEALLSSGNLPDAEAAWLQGEQVASSGPPSVHAKLLFVIADLRERQGRWNDAKAAWKRYADFAAQNADAGVFPASAETRIKDTSAMQTQDKDYVIVRKRIRDEDGGTVPGAKLPPPEPAIEP
jgi:tetratricopeptide (TPR) repeat protein